MKNDLAIVDKPFNISFVERDIPALQADEVLIGIRSAAICGSDLHIYKGKHPSVNLPTTIGHELAGDIIEIGDPDSRFSIADRVTLEPVIECKQCDACKRGEYGYCENINFTYRVGDGAFAKFIVAKEDHVFLLPDYLSYDTGALIEPFAVATHAVRRAGVKLGDKVCVLGAGAIGIMIAALCVKMGAEYVAITDLSDFRLQVALKMGVNHAINSKNLDLIPYLKELTGFKGMDKTFECVGLEQTFNQGINLLEKNGLMTVVGIFERPNITIDASRFITHEVHVQGSQGYCWDFPVALYMAERVPLDLLITHHFSLHGLKDAFDTSLNRDVNSLKTIIHP